MIQVAWIVLKYSAFLTAIYIVLFAIDRKFIRRGGKTLVLPILFAIIIILALAFREILNLQNGFWPLVASGLSITVLAEVFLQFYKFLVIKSVENPKKLIPYWYLKIPLLRNVLVTIGYGIIVSIPLALHYGLGNTTYTVLATILLAVLFVTRERILTKAKKWKLWPD